jgi:polyhydroxybutyrate depolymerase
MRFAAAVALLLVLGAAAAYFHFGYAPGPPAPALGGKVETGAIQGRTYLSYSPAHQPASAPLIVVLHGSTLDGATMRRWTGYEFDVLADARGFNVVYPDGYKGNWNDCRRKADSPSKRENIDDVGFIKALVDRIPHGKVYVFGYSNGGQMAYRLASEAPELFAGIAAVSANLPAAENNQCGQSGKTPPVLLVNGTADPIVPFTGGESSLFGFASRGQVLSAAATAQAFAARNDLPPPMVVALAHAGPSDSTAVSQRTWSSRGAPFIVQYIVKGGGHVVPQPVFRYPRILGPMTGDLDAVARSVSFFLRQ